MKQAIILGSKKDKPRAWSLVSEKIFTVAEAIEFIRKGDHSKLEWDYLKYQKIESYGKKYSVRDLNSERQSPRRKPAVGTRKRGKAVQGNMGES